MGLNPLGLILMQMGVIVSWAGRFNFSKELVWRAKAHGGAVANNG